MELKDQEHAPDMGIYSVDQSDISSDDHDAQEMRAMGKSQQFRRNFEFWSVLGLSCCTMVTWAGQLITFIQGLENGGPMGVVISLFVTWTVVAAIVASLAELMSMWPTSGGQYHWTYTLASPASAPFLSYMSGWLCVLAWQAFVASAMFLCGTFIQAMIALNSPSYNGTSWQALLLAYATLALGLVCNTLLARWLHAVEWAVFVLYIAGFIVILVVITVMTPQYASAHDVFQVFFNGGGWSSDGVSWFIGLQGIIFAWLGADAAIHLSEEVRNASKVLPRSLMASVLVNGIMSAAILLAVLFCGGNLLAATDSGLYPILAIFTYATGSTAGGTGLSAILLLISLSAVISAIAAASRELWAFARDDALPGAMWLKVVNKRTRLPLRAILVTTIFSMLVNLIQLGSDVALNAVVSLTISAYFTSYTIPFGLLLYRRIQAVRGKGKQPPWGVWTLGRWVGIFCNVYSLMWSPMVVIWSMFPPQTSPDAMTMNWSSTMFGGIIIFALAFWFIDGRRRYRGPVRDAAGGAIEPVIGWSGPMVKTDD